VPAWIEDLAELDDVTDGSLSERIEELGAERGLWERHPSLERYSGLPRGNNGLDYASDQEFLAQCEHEGAVRLARDLLRRDADRDRGGEMLRFGVMRVDELPPADADDLTMGIAKEDALRDHARTAILRAKRQLGLEHHQTSATEEASLSSGLGQKRETIETYIANHWTRESKNIRDERIQELGRVNADAADRGLYNSTVRLNGLRVAYSDALRKLLETRVHLVVDACEAARLPLEGTLRDELSGFLARLQRDELAQSRTSLRDEAMKSHLGSPTGTPQLERALAVDAQRALQDALTLIQAEAARLKLATPETIPDSPMPVPDTNRRRVFIIHGHDEARLLELEKLLKEQWDLQSVVLRDQPGKGTTLIEKFEREATGVDFAIALLTPDDLVPGKDRDAEEHRPRPNVVFELGWFYGRLGRDRVCILRKRGTQIHSDLNGIGYIEFDTRVADKVPELQRELRDAGLVD